MRILLFIVSVLLISTQACRFDSTEELFPAPGGGCDTTTAKYSQAISKILTANCAIPGCHKGAGAAQSIGNFEDHSGIKNYLDNSKQRFTDAINHNAGASPMPKGGAKLSDCDLLLLTTWIDNGYRNN